MEPKPEGQRELKWERVSPPNWVQVVSQHRWHDWIINGEQVGMYRAGRCPRCNDVMAFYTEEIVIGVMEGAHPLPPDQSSCNCNGTHPGRPSTEPGGCGAFGPM